jgi:ribose transport system ATP-binding protein
VAKVCHRALIFNRGRVVAELAADDLSVENLLAAASASVRRSEPLLDASPGSLSGAHAVH